MLEFSSCKRGNDIKNTSIELEELRILITDTENVKNDISSEPYKCIGANSLDDFEEKVSFTANDGTDKKGFSYEERVGVPTNTTKLSHVADLSSHKVLMFKSLPFLRSRGDKLFVTGMEKDERKEDGPSPLHIACQNGHDSTVQLLLSKGADINLCMEYGASPLYMACQNGHNSTVQLLLNKGADINLCMEDGASPLFIACQKGHDSTVQLLLDHGADINSYNKDNVSPLYIAFAWRQYKTVNILLKRNADTRLSSGLNPSYLDLVDKNDSTIQYLLRKDNIYNNIYDPDSYFSLFVFCHVERMSRALFFIHFYNSKFSKCLL
eukprot:XP_019919693.1 PREDICTED: ankyrin repeat and SOCS box protein 3-like [Crassostrea gigas]